MRRVRLVMVATAICMLVLSSSASASSSVVPDPAGDAAAGSPAYVDIVQAKITAPPGHDTINFSTELAAAIPADPPDSFLGYNWFLGSKPVPDFDFVVVVRFCTERSVPACLPGMFPRWEAFVTDFARTKITFISSFKVDGAVVKAFVDPALIGDRSSYRWAAITRTRPAAPGVPPVDFAPPRGVLASFSR